MVPFLRFGFATALLTAAPLLAQLSPAAKTSITVAGKTIRIDYSAPSMRGRKIFGGLEPYGRVWRAGANSATALHTDANLDIGGLSVPKGDYTLFVNLANPASWELIVNKQTGQSGLEYDAKQDLGRVKMTMSKPPAMVEQMKFTLSSAGGNKARLELAWEDHVASVMLTVK